MSIKGFFISIVPLCTLLLSGCKTTMYTYSLAEKGENMDVFFDKGVETITSSGEYSNVTLVVDPGTCRLGLVIDNTGADRIDFDPQKDIQVTAVNAKGVPMAFNVVNPDVYVSKVVARQNFAIAMQQLSSNLNAANAGYSSTVTTGSAVGSGGYAIGSSVSTSYNATAVAQMQAQNDAVAEQKRTQVQQEAKAASDGMLRKSTIFHQNGIKGFVYLGMPGSVLIADEFDVKITCGDDVHEFHFLANKIQQ